MQRFINNNFFVSNENFSFTNVNVCVFFEVVVTRGSTLYEKVTLSSSVNSAKLPVLNLFGLAGLRAVFQIRAGPKSSRKAEPTHSDCFSLRVLSCHNSARLTHTTHYPPHLCRRRLLFVFLSPSLIQSFLKASYACRNKATPRKFQVHIWQKRFRLEKLACCVNFHSVDPLGSLWLCSAATQMLTGTCLGRNIF